MFTNDERIAFSQQYPWPRASGWPEEMARRFLGDLISSPENIFEWRVDGERAGLAVLLDRVRNKGGNANLEVLGLRDESQAARFYGDAIAWAKTRVSSALNGFDVNLPPELSELAAKNGLELYYRTFGMLHESPGSVPAPPAGLCTIVTDRDEEELYELLKTSFADNVETNISDFPEWQAARRVPSRSKTWGVWQEKKLVAFLQLIVPKQVPFAEVRTVGVLPSYRGRGFAKALLQRALGYVAQLEISRCALTVAADNENALRLYRDLGFREVERQTVYRWRR